MSWCEACAKYWKPSELDEKGGCPTCGAVVGDPPKVPWHFKLLAVATVVYVGFRIIQMIGWVIR